MRTIISLLVLALLVAGGVYVYFNYIGIEPANRFRTAEVKCGDLLPTISATGTIEPEEVVDVGAQVAGKIKEFGRDPDHPEKAVDYTTEVKDGTVLAVIDDAVYAAEVDQAKAGVKRAEADLLQAQAKVRQAEQDYKRAEGLLATKVISAADFDLAKANIDVALANVEVAVAAIDQAKATLRRAQTNLDYTVIKSPVDGVIVDRRVNVGQTVVASLNAPSLFLIAKDLRLLEVWASVNEADIGRIHLGQQVKFTVDAFPKDEFKGKVEQIRLNATMTQNVVTYTVVVGTENPDLKLRPYQTANLLFDLEPRTGVLYVPNAALRWKPRVDQVAPEYREAFAASSRRGPPGGGGGRGGPAGSGEGSRAGGGRPEGDASKPDATNGNQAGHDDRPQKAKAAEERGRVWVVDGNFVRPIDVRVGPSDGNSTEISGKALSENMEVVIGAFAKEQAPSGTTNPFAPQIFRQPRGEQRGPQ